ncbi:MAG: hypothetical protein IJU12_01975 [Clostridia bacterium]|nr:hypothetical protein [Clostridia bacterium]
MQPPQNGYPNSENEESVYPSEKGWTQQVPQGQEGPWVQQQPQNGQQWSQPSPPGAWPQMGQQTPQEAWYQPGQPTPPNGAWTQPDTQWVQRVSPGQGAYDPYARGQVPPPAQIAPDPQRQAGMPPPAGYYVPNGGQAPGNGGQPLEEEQEPPAQSPSSPPPQQPYRAPSTGLPRNTARNNRLWPAILALLLIGFGVFAVIRLTSPGQTAYGYVRSGSLTALYTGDAVLARNEMVYAEESVSQIDYVAAEGKQVERGALVATIYKAGFSTKDRTTLQNYRSQIKEYQKILIDSVTTDANLLARMTAVRSRAMEVQRLVQGAKGDLIAVESQLAAAMQEQQIYIKQKFPDDQKLSRLYDDENTQLQRIANWTKQCASGAKGTISFYTDGYEKGLNMTTYADFSPAQVREMYNGKAPAVETSTRNSTDIYRLVREEPWVVLMLCHDTSWTPIDGRTYNLVIESFDNSILTATVDSFTRSGGELLIRLLVQDTSFLPNILYLRSCQVRIGENVNSLMVPSRAIFVQNGRKGVVLATEGGEYWTGVEVVSDDGTTAYVVPDNARVLYDGVPVRLF